MCAHNLSSIIIEYANLKNIPKFYHKDNFVQPKPHYSEVIFSLQFIKAVLNDFSGIG